jgi:hypothetical protein
VQDIKAYHVYRGESEAGPYTWVGGATVAIPPDTPVVLTEPYTPPAGGAPCALIPLESVLQASAGSLLAAPAPSGMLLVIVADADINVGLARLEMLKAAEVVS